MTTDGSSTDPWSIYLANEDVFSAVLRTTGPWSLHDGMDVIHDFVVDQLPNALNTYQTDRPIKPWLFVVFRNFARRRAQHQQVHKSRWRSLTEIGDLGSPETEDGESSMSETDLIRGREAIAALPQDERECLLSYFGSGGGSVRAIAERFGWSRYRARQKILTALANLVVRLDAPGLSDLELDICRARLLHDHSWETVSEEMRIPVQHLKTQFREALAKLRQLLST